MQSRESEIESKKALEETQGLFCGEDCVGILSALRPDAEGI